MTSERRFEQELPSLLADLYLGPPPDYRHDIVRRAALTPQRPAWTFPERWLPMSVVTFARGFGRPVPWRKVGLLAVLALLLAAAAAVYVGSQSKVPAPFGPARNGVMAFAEAGDIVLVDPISGTRTIAAGGPGLDSSPAFSRDGTRLAFLRGAEDSMSLWLANANGSNPRELASGLKVYEFEAGPTPSRSLEWSPDGRSILLNPLGQTGRAISIVSTEGNPSVRTLELEMAATGPTWRPPDGREILFRAQTPTGWGLFAVRPDGTGLRPITPANGIEWDGLFFSWSPDGSRIAYQWRETTGPQAQRLYVVGADGGAPRPITTAESVGGLWSPDGTKIAFFDADSSLPGDVAPVSVVEVDGSNRRTALSTDGGGSFTWAPDSKSLIWLPESSDNPVLLDAGGGPARPVSWSAETLPDWQRLAP
jgi:Tol biopolymer transport system component